MNYCNKSKFNSQTQDRLIVFKIGQNEGDPRQWGVWHRDCQTWSRNLRQGKPFTTPKTTCLVLLYPRQGLGPRQGGGPRRSKRVPLKECCVSRHKHIVPTEPPKAPSAPKHQARVKYGGVQDQEPHGVRKTYYYLWCSFLESKCEDPNLCARFLMIVGCFVLNCYSNYYRFYKFKITYICLSLPCHLQTP